MWSSNDTTFYADAIGFSWDANYAIGENYECGNITDFYAYSSTKLDGFSPCLMNLPADALKLIIWLRDYENSDQGKKPQNFNAYLEQWWASVWDKAQEEFQKLIDDLVMFFLENFPWAWLLIRAAMLILIYILFSFIILMVSSIFMIAKPAFLIICELIAAETCISEDSIKIYNDLTYVILGYNTGLEYISLWDFDVPTLYLSFENDKIDTILLLNFFSLFKSPSMNFFEDLFPNELQASSLDTINLHSSTLDVDPEQFWLGFSTTLGIYSYFMNGEAIGGKALSEASDYIKLLVYLAFVFSCLSAAIGVFTVTAEATYENGGNLDDIFVGSCFASLFLIAILTSTSILSFEGAGIIAQIAASLLDIFGGLLSIRGLSLYIVGGELGIFELINISGGILGIALSIFTQSYGSWEDSLEFHARWTLIAMIMLGIAGVLTMTFDIIEML